MRQPRITIMYIATPMSVDPSYAELMFRGIPNNGHYVPHSDPEWAKIGAVEWVEFAEEDTVLENASLDTGME